VIELEKKTYFAQDRQGNVIPNATVHIFQAGTDVLAETIIALNGERLSNPFNADGDGAIVFSMPDGLYDMRISSGALIGQRISFQCLDVTETVASASYQVERAEAAADRAEAAKILGNPYNDLPEAEAAIASGEIPDGSTFNVRAPDSLYYIDEYRNIGGIATPTGKHIPNATYVAEAKLIAERVDNRTNGLQSTAVSKYLFELLSKNGYLIIGADEKGVVLVDKLNAAKAVAANDVVINNVIQLNHSQIALLNNASYLSVEQDQYGRIVWATRPDFTKEYQGMPLVTDRGLLLNSLFYVGDSITAFGIAYSGENNTGTSYKPCLSSQSWPAWAMMMTNGKVRYVGQSATGGYTSAQILNEHIPKAIAAKPTFCVLMAGRNDVFQYTTITIDQTIANLKRSFLLLRKAGIIPVVCTMSAHSGNNDAQRLMEHQINAWLRGYARKHRLPLVDLHAATVNTDGNWLPGYNKDASHPTPLGAKTMGKALADAMAPWLSPNLPLIANEQLTPAVTQNLVDNPLFLDNDGVTPTGWAAVTTGTSVVEADPGIKGNAWRLTGGGTVFPKYTKTVDVVAGTTYGFGFNFKSASTRKVEFYLLAGDSSSTVHLGGLRRWDQPTDDWGYFYGETTIPAGVTQATLVAYSEGTSLSVAQLGIFPITEI
jgi:lysophospholipase L1-like esterase